MVLRVCGEDGDFYAAVVVIEEGCVAQLLKEVRFGVILPTTGIW
jgi:hypothetical protein